MTLFEAADDRVGIAQTLDLLGMAGFLGGDVAMGGRYYEQAIPCSGRSAIASACRPASPCSLQRRRPRLLHAAPMTREAAFWIRRGEQAVAIAREIGWAAGEAFSLNVLSNLTAAQGDLGRALQQAEAAQTIAERIGHRIWTIQAH